MIGWSADIFRLFWGLFYWNTRKTWFRLRRGQSVCPCQAQSDSGRAYETQCDPCLSWNRPVRFRRVCPLLVQTKDGLRCSVNATDVRPVWGQALRYYGSLLLAIYAAGVIVVFAFLRTVGYPVNILHIGLPPLWGRVTVARGAYFLQKSNLAFDQERIAEGLLYLTNAYEFDPTNYAAGLSLAKHLQAGQPSHSDAVFQQLIKDHPDKRHGTTQDWFRALLARGSFERIMQLARDELIEGSPQSSVRIRALVFAGRRVPTDQILRALVANAAPTAQAWRPVFAVELLLRAGQTREARAAIDAPWPANSPAFCHYYRVSVLTEMKDTFAALDLLGRHPTLLDYEANLTLRLDALAAGGVKRLHAQEIDKLLAAPLTAASLPVIKILCSHLIRFPDAATFDRLIRKIAHEPVPLDTGSAGIWFSLFCTAGAMGDYPKLQEISGRLKNASQRPFMVLTVVEAFFRGETAERRITTFLPVLPLPMEVTYSLFERFPPPVAAPTAPQRG